MRSRKSTPINKSKSMIEHIICNIRLEKENTTYNICSLSTDSLFSSLTVTLDRFFVSFFTNNLQNGVESRKK